MSVSSEDASVEELPAREKETGVRGVRPKTETNTTLVILVWLIFEQT